MRDPLVRRLRERRFPTGLIVLGAASWLVLGLVAQIGFRLIG